MKKIIMLIMLSVTLSSFCAERNPWTISNPDVYMLGLHDARGKVICSVPVMIPHSDIVRSFRDVSLRPKVYAAIPVKYHDVLEARYSEFEKTGY